MVEVAGPIAGVAERTERGRQDKISGDGYRAELKAAASIEPTGKNLAISFHFHFVNPSYNKSEECK